MARELSKDPYKNFRFKVYFINPPKDKELVAGVTSVTGLSWSVDVITIDEGGGYQSGRKLPGGITYQAVTLSRGIASTKPSFKEWAEAVWNYSEFNPLKGLRKDLIIDLCDESGFPAIRYNLINCWVSEYNALPELSATDNSIAIESIKVEHEGWTQKFQPEGPKPKPKQLVLESLRR